MRTAMLIVAATVSGCTDRPVADSWFPLDAGHRWQYDMRTEWENDVVDRETRVITSDGEAALADGRAARRRSEDGMEWFLRSDDSGVFRVASRSAVQADPEPDAARRYVLKAPIAVGTTWQASTSPYLLRRRQDFPPEIRHSHPPVPMHYTIESVDAEVTTRAGRHDGCARVRGHAVIRLFADPVVGWRDLPLTTTEWYCRGPGLVKLVREEPANTTFLTGGTVTMELIEWH